jgi:hypothetical protein
MGLCSRPENEKNRAFERKAGSESDSRDGNERSNDGTSGKTGKTRRGKSESKPGKNRLAVFIIKNRRDYDKAGTGGAGNPEKGRNGPGKGKTGKGLFAKIMALYI